MSSSVSSSPLSYSQTSSPELIKTRSPSRSYHVEIGLVILFLCLTIPSLLFLTLIYRRQTNYLPTTPSPPPPSTTSDLPFAFNDNFQRKSLVHYPQARCMDDSVASYYVRLAPSASQSRWLIYLDGGGFCYSKESCYFRRLYSPNLLNANHFDEKKSLIGIFSSLKQYNLIYVPYCSSDLWSGSSNQSRAHGSDIFRAVFDDLAADAHFRQAQQIVFTGFSAGGLGLLVNLPHLVAKFASTLDLRVIIDSGWFIDHPGSANGIAKINEGMAFWNAQIPSSCQLQPRYRCFLGSEAIRFFPSHVRILVIQSLFDHTQLHLDDTSGRANDFSRRLLENLRQSSGRVSVLAPACTVHGFLARPLWPQFDIRRRTLASALNAWLRRKKRTHLRLIDHRFDSSFCPQRESDDQIY